MIDTYFLPLVSIAAEPDVGLLISSPLKNIETSFQNPNGVIQSYSRIYMTSTDSERRHRLSHIQDDGK